MGAITKAYKHVRDAISHGTPIDEQIKNLVQMVPHRSYWEGFLFHPLKEFPDGECVVHPGESDERDVRTKSSLPTQNPPYPPLRKGAAEGGNTTGSTAGPLFNRNYFGTFSPEFISVAGNKYHHFDPKEEIRRGMKLNYLAPNGLGTLEVIDIVDERGKVLEKADCNTKNVYLQTSLELKGWESLYVEPS